MTKPFAERSPQRNVIVWALLVVATLISRSFGIDHGMDYRFSTVVVLLVTFLKVYLVGSNFMELREATLLLRAIFNGVCVVMCAVLIAIYLATG
jgi:heme/copper-type cytochrome/quinol oxidase subunit 4